MGDNLLDKFELVVEQFGDEIALSKEGKTMTYAQVRERSKRLAKSIETNRNRYVDGQSIDFFVPVFFDVSFERICGILGVLYAGGAYVPLDPKFPAARIRTIVDDTGARIVLTSGKEIQMHIREILPSNIAVLSIEELEEKQREEGSIDSSLQSQRQCCSNVMYTSGTTGKPKGVLVTHQGNLRLVSNDQNFHSFSPRDGFVMMSNPAFDASTMEIWGPLLNGGRLYLMPEGAHLDTQRLKHFLEENPITVLFLTVLLFVHHVSQDPTIFRPLETLLVGGEAQNMSAIRRCLLSGAPPKRLYNVYGPTENTTFSTFHLIDSVPSETDSIPIGRPIAHSSCRIVDGELWVGGDGVALGYHGMEAATASKFVTDKQGERWYRTGDQVEMMGNGDDGVLVFKGRMDHLVKLRGQRIELDEVASSILHHHSIAHCVVLAHLNDPIEDASAETCGHANFLAAYFSLGDSKKLPTAAELQTIVGETLPSFCIPSQFYAVVGGIPLTAVGKADRALLRKWRAETNGKGDSSSTLIRIKASDSTTFDDEGDPVVGTRFHQHVREVFADVLRLDSVHEVDINSHFVDLGGDSLSASRATSLLNERLFGLTQSAIESDISYSSPFRLQMHHILESPTVESLARVIEGGLSDSSSDDEVSSSPPHSFFRSPLNNGCFPLSLAQEQIWLHWVQLPSHKKAMYNEPMTFHLKGVNHMDPDRLQRAIRCVVGRHQSLQSRLCRSEEHASGIGQVFDCVETASEMLHTDLRRVLSVQRARKILWQLADSDARRSFDLFNGPLTHWRLVQMPEGADDVLVCAFHHLVMDGYSVIRTMVPELQQVYESDQSGVLPALPLRFSDFVVWERRQELGQAQADLLKWWDERLSGSTPLEWGDFCLSGDLTTTGAIDEYADYQIIHQCADKDDVSARTTFQLPPSVANGLKAIAAKSKLTVFSAYVTLLFVTLRRLLGKQATSDFLLAIISSDRDKHPGLDSVISHQAQFLPLRIVVHEEIVSTFSSLLQHIASVCTDSYRHRGVPMNILPVQARQCNVGMVIEPSGAGTDETGWVFTQHDVFPGVSKMDFTLILDERPNALLLGVEYSRDTFPEAAIDRFANTFCNLAQVLTATDSNCAHQSIRDLPLLRPLQHKALLELSKSAVHTPSPSSSTLHELLWEKTSGVPNKPAIIDVDELGNHCTLTFGEWKERSTALAQRILLESQGEEDRYQPILLLTKRSSIHYVGAQAIMMAGSPYVPLHSGDPLERQLSIVEQLNSTLIVVDSANLQGALALLEASTNKMHLVVVDSSTEGNGAVECSLPLPSVSPTNLAYILFTSGSSGTPKGVMVEHQAIVSRCIRSPSESSAVWLNLLQLAFDGSMIASWLVWCTGASTSVLPSRSLLQNVPLLVRSIPPSGVSHVLATPGLHWLLLEEMDRSPIESNLECAICGGDSMSYSLYSRLRSQYRRVINVYGPTEATIYCCAFNSALGGSFQISDSVVPIGAPVLGSRAFIMEIDGTSLLPPGAVGELVIGGEGLALGYLGRPEETQRSFIVDESNTLGEGSMRLYCTGDLAYWNAQGQLMFSGRIDRGAKVAGFRVDLREIEAAVEKAAPDVGRVVCLVNKTHQELVAFGVGLPPSIDLIRQSMRRSLPSHMIPSRWISLESMPLTPRGKADEKALLQEALLSHKNNNDDEQRPINRSAPLKTQLIQLFGVVLDIPSVQEDDDFFELGGTSLLAMQLVSLANAHGVTALTLTHLTRYRTPAQIAEVFSFDNQGTRKRREVEDSSLISQQFFEGNHQNQILVDLHNEDADSNLCPLFLFHPAGGQSLSYAFLADKLRGYSQRPIIGIDSDQTLYNAMSHSPVVDQYTKAILRRQPTGPYLLGGWSLGGIFAHLVAAKLEEAGHTVVAVIHIDSRPPTHRVQQQYIEMMLSDLPAFLSLMQRHFETMAGKCLEDLTYKVIADWPVDKVQRFIQALVDGGIFRNVQIARPFVMRFFDEFQATNRLMQILSKQEEMPMLRSPGFLFRADTVSRPHEGFVALEEQEEEVEGREERSGRCYGWSKYYDEGSFKVLSTPGTHENCVSVDNVGVLAERMHEVIHEKEENLLY